MLFSNIPLLWEILELTVQDWKREVMPLQTAINNSTNNNERLFLVSKALITLQSHYLKCLFSYVVFFIALKGAYDKFYGELNTLNRKSFLKVLHGKPPNSTSYIEKVKMIRNISVAHMGSSKVSSKKVNSRKVSAATAAAAMMWQPLTIGKKIEENWDIDKMTFGEMRLIFRDATGKVVDQSEDLEIQGICEIDNTCRQYLDQYDRLCVDFLKAIHARLPISVGDEKYFEFKTNVSSV